MTAGWSTHLCPWLCDAFDRLDQARDRGLFGHAWLLAGPRGIGKSNLAHVLAARLVNGQQGKLEILDASSAVGARDAAVESSVRHPDLHVLKPLPDKRTISVEQVRDVIADLSLTSLSGVGKVLIVEPAEAMTLAAANALLKTLEEPTADTYFLLVSHQPGFLPATIRSRCQLLWLPSPGSQTAADWLFAGEPAVGRTDIEALLGICGGAPLLAAQLIADEKLTINKELTQIFVNLHEEEAAHAALQGWLKDDAETMLAWLALQLEWAIKARLAPDAWTPVTDADGESLHNAWRGLTLETLFERHADAVALRRQIGGGTNLELGLRVLVQGMIPGVASCE